MTLNRCTFTPVALANFLSEKLLSYQESDNLKVLDPSCGNGALLMAISNNLQKSNKHFELYGFDSNDDYLSIAIEKLKRNNQITNANLTHTDFLAVINESTPKSPTLKRCDVKVLQAPMLHSLKGRAKDYWAVDLVHPFRLIIEPLNGDAAVFKNRNHN